MTTLYSCKSEINIEDKGLYRITKFDEDMNVVSSYRTNGIACTCPAGERPTCRHRQMLPRFLARGAVNTFWLHDFDRNGWVSSQIQEAEMICQEQNTVHHSVEAPPAQNITATEIDARIAEPRPMPGDGIIMLGLDNLLAVHNAIADAVGEPRVQARPTSVTLNRRGF